MLIDWFVLQKCLYISQPLAIVHMLNSLGTPLCPPAEQGVESRDKKTEMIITIFLSNLCNYNKKINTTEVQKRRLTIRYVSVVLGK